MSDAHVKPMGNGAHRSMGHARAECMSAISALNMRPDPIPIERQRPDHMGFLADTDAMASHAMEHMQAALLTIGNAMFDYEQEIITLKLRIAALKSGTQAKE